MYSAGVTVGEGFWWRYFLFLPAICFSGFVVSGVDFLSLALPAVSFCEFRPESSDTTGLWQLLQRGVSHHIFCGSLTSSINTNFISMPKCSLFQFDDISQHWSGCVCEFWWRTERSGVSNTNLRALVGGRVVFNTRANFVSFAILGQRRLCACTFERELYDKNHGYVPRSAKWGNGRDFGSCSSTSTRRR